MTPALSTAHGEPGMESLASPHGAGQGFYANGPLLKYLLSNTTQRMISVPFVVQLTT